MKRVVAALVVVAAAFGVVPPSAAGGRSAAISEVALDPDGSDCSNNPQIRLSWQTIGSGFGEFGVGSIVGTPTPAVSITASPLFDNANLVDASFGIVLPGNQPEGSLIGGYAAIGDPSLDPSVTFEAFILYRCFDEPGASAELFRCLGPYGSCPKTVDEAQRWPPQVGVFFAVPVLLPGAPYPGFGAAVLSGVGCWDGSARITFTDAAGAVHLDETVTVDQTGRFESSSVSYSPTMASGRAEFAAVCTLEGSQPAIHEIDVRHQETTTTTAGNGRDDGFTAPRFAG